MLRELKFVQGAVSKKNFVPELTHFHIAEGRVRAFNGSLALCAPIAVDIECSPKAVPLVKAIGLCGDSIMLSLSSNGKLKVKSGNFQANIEVLDKADFIVEPKGELVEFDGKAVFDAFTRLLPFVGDDASRPWTNGILLKGTSAFATNNVMLAEYWLGVEFPHVVNIPRAAILEMVRVDEPPTHAQMDENSITFHYTDGRWIRTQLYEIKWPEVTRILDVESSPESLPEGFFEALEMLSSFSDDVNRVYIDGDTLSTSPEEGIGAQCVVPGLNAEGIYQINMLKLLKGAADVIDMGRYPEPAVFFSGPLRGAVVGMLK